MYKNKICGVYLITNNLNGMSYAGQSRHCKYRWLEHKKPSKNVAPIDKAINEYGAENFTFKIEKECLPEELDFYERETIKKYNTLWSNGYNKYTGGKSGFDMCEESKRKLSELEKGKKKPPHSEDTKRKMSETKKNTPKPKWLTPEGEIREMITTNAQRWHPDWVLIEKDL